MAELLNHGLEEMSMNLKIKLLGAVTFLAMFTAMEANAQASQNINVEATVNPTCVINGGGTDLAMDFGVIDVTSNADTSINASFTWRCSDGTAVEIELDAGTNATDGSAPATAPAIRASSLGTAVETAHQPARVPVRAPQQAETAPRARAQRLARVAQAPPAPARAPSPARGPGVPAAWPAAPALLLVPVAAAAVPGDPAAVAASSSSSPLHGPAFRRGLFGCSMLDARCWMNRFLKFPDFH